MPTAGLTMYMPFNDSITVPVIGDEFEVTGNGCTLTTEDGIKCAYFNGDGGLKNTTGDYYSISNTKVTLSFWTKYTGGFGYINDSSPFCIGNWYYYNALEPTFIQSYFRCKMCYAESVNLFNGNNYWFHCVITFGEDGNYANTYINGIPKSKTQSYNTLNIVKVCGFGGSFTTSNTQPRDKWFTGYIAGARIYNRVLTNSEIQELAHEYYVSNYPITASDLNFNLYQKNETYGITYNIPFNYTPTFEIIEGTLPNTISFNTSTGQFTGKGLTDADHTYNLKVSINAYHCENKTINVTINTYKTARISMSNQTFNFISNKAEAQQIAYTSDETVTMTIVNGSMPIGMTFYLYQFWSNASNTSAETTQVVVRATSEHNQTGVIATMTLNMQMNAIVCNDQTLKFYVEQGAQTKSITYSGSLNTVSDAIFLLSGTLPTGMTFDTTTGTFTSDATQTVDETATVNVTVSSSGGTSTAATAAITIEIHTGAQPIPTSGLVMYHPLDGSTQDITTPQIGSSFTVTGTSPTLTTQNGIDCAYFAGNGGLKQTNQNYWTYNNPTVTLSIWGKCLNTTNAGAFATGKWVSNDAFEIMKSTYWKCVSTAAYIDASSSIDIYNWHHICITLDKSNTTGKLYIDGILIGSNTYGINLTNCVAIGANLTGSENIPRDGWFNGYLAAARIYNRVLSDAEIHQLASEFTPTVS